LVGFPLRIYPENATKIELCAIIKLTKHGINNNGKWASEFRHEKETDNNYAENEHVMHSSVDSFTINVRLYAILPLWWDYDRRNA